MKIVKSLVSNDKKVIKYLQQTRDKHIIETGYYNLDEEIICISSQIGCPMRCVFCATGTPIDLLNPDKYFIRNLSYKEIVRQVENVLADNKLKAKRILFSYMGMGEPFLNYKNVVKGIKILSNNFINSRSTIATIGIKPLLIKELANEKINTILKLHLSLHAPNDILRSQILLKSGKIKSALNALRYFSLKRNISSHPFTVKLSNLNNFKNLKSSNTDKFNMFEKILNSYGIETCRFFSRGTDIQAGCGQLRRYFYKTI